MKFFQAFLIATAVKAFIPKLRNKPDILKPHSIPSPLKPIPLTMSDTKDITVLDTPPKKEETTPSKNKGAWIPVGSASALQGLTPVKITIMGRDFAVWQDETTLQWSVVQDMCPHRLAPLSQGRVDPKSGCIECPYHGWQFDTKGSCTKIPQLEETKSFPVNSNVMSYPVHMAGDLIFVFLPEEMHGESYDLDVLPEDYYPYLKDGIERGEKYFTRDLPYSFDFLLENFMDPAHIPFAHHGLQSKRIDATPIPIKELINTQDKIELSFEDVTRGKTRTARMAFQVPSQYHFRQNFNGTDTFSTGLVIYCIPVKAGKSRVMIGSGERPIPSYITWLAHAGSNRFLNTDTWLHDAERNAIIKQHDDGSKQKGFGLDYAYASESDVGTIKFRQWWKKRFASSPPHSFGAATPDLLGPNSIPRQEQINPWENHAKHCSTCRNALQRMKLIQKLSLYVTVGSVLVLKRYPIMAFFIAATGISSNFFCRKSATVIEGNPYAGGIGYRPVSTEMQDESDGKWKRNWKWLKFFYL